MPRKKPELKPMTPKEVKEYFKQVVESYGYDWKKIERMSEDPKVIEEGKRLLRKLDLSGEIQRMRDEERNAS